MVVNANVFELEVSVNKVGGMNSFDACNHLTYREACLKGNANAVRWSQWRE
jgi:hypothetical protein